MQGRFSMPATDPRAHACCRLGQEPPPPQHEDSYDGRSLAEVSNRYYHSICCIHFLLLVRYCVETCSKQGLYFQSLFFAFLLKVATDSKTGSLGRKKQAWYYNFYLTLTHLPTLISALANQFRALEEDEIMFLDSIRERQEEEERQRKEKDGEEMKLFRE